MAEPPFPKVNDLDALPDHWVIHTGPGQYWLVGAHAPWGARRRYDGPGPGEASAEVGGVGALARGGKPVIIITSFVPTPAQPPGVQLGQDGRVVPGQASAEVGGIGATLPPLRFSLTIVRLKLSRPAIAAVRPQRLLPGDRPVVPPGLQDGDAGLDLLQELGIVAQRHRAEALPRLRPRRQRRYDGPGTALRRANGETARRVLAQLAVPAADCWPARR